MMFRQPARVIKAGGTENTNRLLLPPGRDKPRCSSSR
nr:MAG TPA: hypothetical protein [Herelleviridae sp.]